MPDAQVLTIGGHFIGLHHRISGAFNAVGDTQGLQQIACKRGFAGSQITMQTQQGLRQGRA